MKHLKLFATLSIISLLAVWSMAVITVQTTTPLVNPDGTLERAGSFRLIFSAPEFIDEADVWPDTEGYFLVRIQMSKNIKLVKLGTHNVGTLSPTGTWIPVAWEIDAGAPILPIDYTAIRVVRAEPDFVDLLFLRDMSDLQLSATDRLRCTIGTPACATPSTNLPFNNFEGVAAVQRDCDGDGALDAGAYYQEDTILCLNFATSATEFAYDDFWRVGLSVYFSDPNGSLGPRYSVNFDPSDPSLAQKGGPGQVCDLVLDWPCKGEPCVFENWTSGCMEAPEVHVCPIPPPPDQDFTPGPCAGGTLWINESYDIQFGKGHMFSIWEDCPTGYYAFEPGGKITITLASTAYNEDGYTCTDLLPNFPPLAPPDTTFGQFWIFGPLGEQLGPFPGTRISSSKIEFNLPLDTVWTTFDPDYGQYCVLADLEEININTCCLLNFYTDDVFELRVTVDYVPAGYNCGYKPAATPPFTVAYIYGCLEPDPEPVEYDLYLWFPFLAPVNNPEVNWWCGVALTNYAAQATEDGIFWMWEEDGDEYSIILPPLGAHEMWLRNLTDPVFQAAVPSVPGVDTLWGDEAMSGLVVYTVVDMDYPPNYAGGFKDDGAMAGIDAFVLMGDYEQAYGYTARHVDGAQVWNDTPGRAPGWAKKGTKK
ncbi:MAG TPA: hypothetical protein PK176_13300 [Acidobacteriota bacterium]|nr:hypothetical protein [Acidobacteriota bacterium]